MSFAAPKFYPQQQQFRQQSREKLNSRMNIPDNFQNFQMQQIPQQMLSSPSNFEGRFSIIESNLSRLCSQQDALLPLLSMNEIIPNLMKSESLLKNVNKKYSENEDRWKKVDTRMTEIDNLLKKQVIQPLQQKNQNSSMENSQQFENHPVIKSLNGKTNQLANCISDLQNDIITFQKLNETKIKEEERNLQKDIEQRIDNYKQSFSQQIDKLKVECSTKGKQNQQSKANLHQNTVQAGLKKEDVDHLIDKKISLVVNQISNKISEQITAQVEEQVQNILQTELLDKFSQLKTQFDDETNNIYKEIGQIKCELDQITSTFRKQFIAEKVSEFPDQLDELEYEFKLHNLEEEVQINELEQFCQDNTERMSFECRNIESKVDKLQKVIEQETNISSEDYSYIKSEIEFLTQRYVELNYQLGGSKKKYAFDMRKIEEKIEKIKEIEDSAIKVAQVNKKIKRTIEEQIQFQETLSSRVQQLFQLMNQNLDSTSQLLEVLESKLSSCSAQFQKF